MSFILPLLYIVCGSGTMALLSKRRFEVVLPVFLLLSILIVFIFGFCGQMQFGYITVLLFALAFPVVIAYRLVRHEEIARLKSDFFTPAFCIFIVIYVFIFFLNYNRGFSQWDEISHWGPMVKEMFRLDKFYSVAESALSVHKDYPPAVTIFETMWCKLCGGYREAYLYKSLQILSLSLFFPSLAKLNWKKDRGFILKLVLFVVAILSAVLIVRVGEASFYRSIYIDCFLGLMLAYSLSLVIYEQQITKFGIFNLSVALSVLLITKQMGVVFFLLVVGVFVVNYLVIHWNELKMQRKFRPQKKSLLPFVATALSIAVIPYLFYFAWNKYVALNDIAQQFSTSNINFAQLIGIAKGTIGETYQHEALINFVKAIVDNTFVGRPLAFTYWQLMIVAVVVFLVIGKYGKNYFKKHQICSLNILLFLGAMGYAAALLLLYVFCFGPYEGPKLASLTRYVNTYWYAVFVLALMLFFYIECKKEAEGKRVTFLNTGLVVVFMWVAVFSAETVHDFLPAFNYTTATSVCAEDATTIENNTKASDSIFIIAQDTSGYENYMIMYLVLPRTCNRFDYSLGTAYDESDIYTVDLTVAEWQAELANWDYLYLQNVDDAFISKYRGAFEAGAAIENGQLYKIDQQGDGAIVLDLVE